MDRHADRAMGNFHREVIEAIEELTPVIIAAEKAHGLADDQRGNILRKLHNLKGAAKIVNNTPAAQLVHGIESLFKQQHLQVLLKDRRFFDLVIEGFDALARSAALAGSRDYDGETAMQPLIQRLEELQLEHRVDPLQAIADAFPGIPDSTRDFLTEDQERELLDLAGSNAPVYTVAVDMDESHLISQTRAIGLAMEQAGRIVSCTCSGFTGGGQVSFLYVLAGDGREHVLGELLAEFPVTIEDARHAAAGPAPAALPPLVAAPPLEAEPAEDSPEIARIMQELRARYLTDFPEQLDHINAMLSQLEHDRGNRALIDDIFRFGHSLKSTGGTYGFGVLTQLASAFEDVLGSVRAGATPLSPELVDLLYEWVDTLSGVIQELRSGNFSEGKAYAILGRMRGLLHPETAVPPELAPRAAALPAAARMSEDSIRVALDKIELIINSTGELINRKSGIQQVGKDMRIAMERTRAAVKGWAASLVRLRHAPATQALLAVPEAAELLRGMGETLKAIAERQQELFDGQERLAADLTLLIDKLGTEALLIRMLPVKSLFQKFPRMVRDISRSLGKEVDLELAGEDTEIDKVMLEQLNDPLLHMLRNSIDHGIELPEVRARAGKPRRGVIGMRAYHQQNRVLIELSDDGSGLDPRRIGERAQALGLVSEEQLGELGEQELLGFIFAPGFTTRHEVTEVSGRGVGMDVVRANVSAMHGEIEIRSRPGAGTTFVIKLPLTLSIIQGLMIRDDGANYCIPSLSILEVLKAGRQDFQELGGGYALRYREHIMPVVSLRQVLGTGAGLPPEDDFRVVVLAGLQHRVGLAVTATGAEEEIMLKPLGSILRRVENVSGVTIRSRGDLAVILDAASLVRNAGRLVTGIVPAAARQAERGRKGSILVVEDSVTSREMIMNILEIDGYEVQGAANGRDAWELLAGKEFDLMVTDLDMPVMDGLELTRRLRAEPRLARLPVIMVTSLGSDDERRRGLEAGANAYIVKQSFEQGSLLQRARELIGVAEDPRRSH